MKISTRTSFFTLIFLAFFTPTQGWAAENVPGVMQELSMFVQLFATTSTDPSVPDECMPAAPGASFRVVTPIERCNFSTSLSVLNSPDKFGLYDACTGETRPDATVRVEWGNSRSVQVEGDRKFFSQNIFLGVKIDGEKLRGFGDVAGGYGISVLTGAGEDEHCRADPAGLPWVSSEGVGWTSFNPVTRQTINGGFANSFRPGEVTAPSRNQAALVSTCQSTYGDVFYLLNESGDSQIGGAFETLPEPIAVKLLSAGTPAANSSVRFFVVQEPAGNTTPASVQLINGGATDSDGVARAYLTLGALPGTYVVQASYRLEDCSADAFFSARVSACDICGDDDGDGIKNCLEDYCAFHDNCLVIGPGDHIDRNNRFDTAERDISGPINGRICRGSSDFEQLTFYTNPNVVFGGKDLGDDPGKEDEDNRMQSSAAGSFEHLAQWATCEGIKLTVTDAYDSDLEHGTRSLHYEGRAIDIDTPTRSNLERIAYLAHLAGFDWVWHEGDHVHVSVQGSHAQQDTNCECTTALPDADGNHQGVLRGFGYAAGGCFTSESTVTPVCPRGGISLDSGDHDCSQIIPSRICCGYTDLDSDSLPDPFDPNPQKDDTDNDGLTDGNLGSEDLNINGVVDPGETDPTKFDTDGDGLSDGVEQGLTVPEGDDTDLNIFVPDTDPATVTDALNPDTDGDGLRDGAEDRNHNGAVDVGETSALSQDSDADGVFDRTDNCPVVANPSQDDLDHDGVGDACANRFRRADANGSGVVDLSDGIYTLGWLFSGTAAPLCLDAADANDSGGIDLSDAVYTFAWLFTGGTIPPAPGPFNRGVDPSSDALTCNQYPSDSSGGG